MPWRDITTSDKYRALEPKDRGLVKDEYFRSKLLPKIQERTQDNDLINAAYSEFMETPDDTGEGLARSMLGSAARGFLDPLAAVPEVAGAFTGIEGLEDFGSDIRSTIEGAFPVNPAQEGFLTDVAGVGGQVGQIVATGGAGALTGARLLGQGATEAAKRQAMRFGATAAQQTAMGSSAVAGGLERAEQLGLEGGDRLLRGAIAGGTELLAERLGGFATELGGVGKAAGFADTVESGFMKPIIRGIGTEAGEEGLAEAAGQATDIAMAPEAAPGMDLKNIGYAMLLGGVGGAAFGGIEAAITPRTKKAFDGTTDFIPSSGPPPGMTVEDAEEKDLLKYGNAGEIIGYVLPVSDETIEGDLPLIVDTNVEPLVENVAAAPEASATASALRRIAAEGAGAPAATQEIPDEIVTDEATALRDAGLRMLTGQPAPIPAQAETVTPAPVAEQIITEQEDQAALEQQQQIETPISEQPANVAPRASNSVQPRPERVGRNTDARDAWDEQFGSLRRGGRTHNDDGTPYQPTVFDEVMGQVTEGLKGNSIDENIDAIGVDAGIESGTAVKQLLNDGWVWDEQVKRMVDTKNRGESPAAALRRIRSKKGQQQQPTETNVPLTQETLQQEQSRGQELQEPRELPILPAEQAAQAPEAASGRGGAAGASVEGIGAIPDATAAADQLGLQDQLQEAGAAVDIDPISAMDAEQFSKLLVNGKIPNSLLDRLMKGRSVDEAWSVLGFTTKPDYIQDRTKAAHAYHVMHLISALKTGQPISAKAIDDYGLAQYMEDYQGKFERKGNFYVPKKTKASEESPSAAAVDTQAALDTQGDGIVRDEGIVGADAELEQQKATLPVDGEGAMLQGGDVRQEETQQVSLEQSNVVPTESLPATGQLTPRGVGKQGGANIPVDKRDSVYEKLLAKGKPAGRNMVSLDDSQVTTAIRKKLYSDRDAASGFPGRPQETQSFYLKPKSEVTGIPSDKGWILKDKRPDLLSRLQPKDATPTPQAQPQPATPVTQETKPQAAALATQPATQESTAAQPAAGETGDAGVAISPTGETVESSETSSALSKLQSYINTLSPKAQAAWTPERLAAAESYYATGNESALEPLTATQRKIVMREGVSESDAAAYEEKQKRQFALRNPPAATDSQFLEDYNAYVNSLSDETLQKESESRDESTDVDGPSAISLELSNETESVEQLPDTASLEEVQQVAPVSLANAAAAAASAPSKAKWLEWMRSNLAHLMRFAEKIWKQATATIAVASSILSPSGTKVDVSNDITPQEYSVSELVAKPSTFGRIAPWVASQKPSIKVSQNNLDGYAAIDLPKISDQGGEVILNLSGIGETDMKFRKSPLEQAKEAAKEITGDTTMAVLPKRAAKHFLSKGSAEHVDSMAEMLYEQESTSPKIAKMLKDMGISESPDTFPWCATSASYALTRGGTPVSITSSRAFLKFGKATQNPQYGDVVVMWNNNPATGGKSGWGGHVGFYLGEVDGTIAILSGNVNDEVNVSLYSKDRVLGYREVSKLKNVASAVRYKKILRSADGNIRRTGVKSTPARAARNSYIGVIPGVENTWLGTTEDFDAEFPDGYPFDSKNTTPPADTEALVAEDGRAFIFIDRVQVLDGDAERAEQHGTSPGVEAIKRLLRHESFVHRGFMSLLGPLKARFADFVASGVIPEAELDYLVNNGYPQYKGWRDNKTTEMLAAEEWLAQRVERMGRIPQSGPIASIMDWLRDVWRWLTGKETTDLDKLRNTMRAMHKALGALDPKQRIVMELPDAEMLRRSVAQTQQDQEYLAAVERGDMETAQRMVDEAARMAGFTEQVFKAWVNYTGGEYTNGRGEVIGSDPKVPITVIQRQSNFPTFTQGEPPYPGIAGFFAKDKDVARRFLKISKDAVLDRFYINPSSRKVLDANGKPSGTMQFDTTGKPFRDAVRSGDFNSIEIRNTSDEGDVVVALNPNQIKSADPVVRDDAGNIIPPSQRFQSTSSDIRYSKVQRPDPILNQPSRLRGNVPEITKPNAQRRAIYETVEGFEGAVEVIPRQYFPMGSKEKGNEFSATDALLAWSKDLLKPYAEDIGGLVEFLAILRSDERLQSELKLGPRSGAVVMPFLAQEAANRAEALGSRDMRNAFLMEYDALASAGGQNLWAFKAASLHPDFATNRYTAMMDKTEEQNFAATVDKKINKSRTIQDVVSNLPEAGEVAADNVSDGLADEEMIRLSVLELGVLAQDDPELRDLLEELIATTLDLGEMSGTPERASIAARRVKREFASEEEKAVVFEQLKSRQTEILQAIQDKLKAKKADTAKTPAKEKASKPIETAKEIINKITTAAAKVPAKKKQPDAVRSLYRKHLKKPMSEAEFSAEAKTAGLDAATTKGLYDAINLEIVAIEIQAQARAAERAQTKELKKAEREAEKYQNQAEAKINEVADALADPSLTQDKEKVVNPLTEIYRNQIKTPITEPQFVEQVVALGVDEETATLLFSIAAMDRQARIDIRVAREDLRRREMSEAQASKLIYAQEEELRQGSKDREPSKSGDSINKAFREQVVNPLSQEKFRERLDKLKVSQKLADRLYATAERVATDNERAEVYRKRVALLDVDSAALTRFVNDLRLKGKLTGEPIQWRDLLSLPVAHQDTVKAELLARVKRHEALRNLSTGEQQAIADALNTIWQRERRKVFQAMIKKADLMGVSKEDQEVIVDAMPALLKYINQGMLGTSAFYRAVGEKFGIAPISAEARKQVEEMAAKMQEKELYSFERAVLAEKILKILQNNTQLSRAEILSSFWVTSVLSGGRTIFDMALGVLNGGFSIAKKMITATIETRSPKAAIEGLTAFGQGIWMGAQVAAKNLIRPEEGLLASRNPAVADYFDDGARGAGLTTGDKLLLHKGDKPKDKLRRGLGVWMSFFERLFSGLDHINSTATMMGTMRMAAAMNPKLYNAALTPTKQDYANALERAKLRLPDGSNAAQIRLAQSIIEDGQHILERGLDESFMSQWRQLVADSRAEGNTASYQEDPTGAGGLLYKMVRNITSGLEDKTRGYRDDARVSLAEARKTGRGLVTSSVNYFVTSLGYFLGTQAQNLFGVRFMRFTGNKLNELISFIPVVGMARMQEKGMVSGEEYTLRGKNVIANQVLGYMSAFLYFTLLNDLDEEDDEERGWIVNGSWENLTPERKSQLMSDGFKPNTVAFFDKDTGRWTSYNFVSWPFAGWMAAFGSVSDYKRLTPDKWNEKILIDKTMAAAYAGAFAITDISSLSSLTEMFGRSTYTTDPAEAAQKRVIKGTSNFLGGFIPKTFKDIDSWFDETNYKPEESWEHFAKEMPFYRRSVGAPLRDIFYEPVQVSRTPWSRALQVSPDDPAYKALGRLNSRGIWLTPANPENRKVKRGGKLRDMTDEEANAYMAEVGKRYKEFVMKQGDRLLEMDVDRADELVSKYTARIREIAFKKAIASSAKAATR